jgi:hypothetical protein
MRAFSEHCAYLGFPLRNVRWSWAAASRDKRHCLFTIWSDEVHGRRFVLSPIGVRRPGPVGNAADLKAGGKEVAEIAALAADDPSVAAFGVLCIAADPAAVPRVRKSYDDATVFWLRVFRDEGSIVAELVERIAADKLVSSVARDASAP